MMFYSIQSQRIVSSVQAGYILITDYLNLNSICTVFAKYLPSISTNAQYLHSIYTVSTQYIYTVSAQYLHSLNGGAGCLCWPGLGGGWENSSCESSSSSAAAARERGSPSHSERPDHGPNMIPPNNRLCLVLGLHSDSISSHYCTYKILYAVHIMFFSNPYFIMFFCVVDIYLK